MGFFEKIKSGLKKTRDNITGKFDSIINSFKKVDEELFEELEEMLIMADVGVNTSQKICDILRNKVKSQNVKDPSEVKELLKETIVELLGDDEELKIDTKPSIIVVIGVNGVGKTTTIGKMASSLKGSGKKVLVSAADTFRAAAVEQLEVWCDRVGCDIVKNSEGTDPAAVIFDSISAGKSRGSDVIICDTAGRLQNKKNLMDELSKIGRIIEKELPEADKEYLLVLDASTGQNAVSQALEFKKAIGLTGIVLTKLDGTAKGGIVLAIKDQIGVPIKYIGVGEGIDDLQGFEAGSFANAMFSEEEQV